MVRLALSFAQGAGLAGRNLLVAHYGAEVVHRINPDVLAGSGVVAATNTNLSTSFQAGQPFTAPNTTNYATGVLLYLVTAPRRGTLRLTSESPALLSAR